MSEDLVQLSGDPRSRGVEHGRRLAPQIGRLLSDNCARLNLLLDRPVPEDQIYAEVKTFASEIERELPSVAEELEGLAEGAGISYEQAVLLQVRREILVRMRRGSGSDCSTLSLPTTPRVVAQTIDLNSCFGEFGAVFRIAPWRDEPEILMFSFAGLLGYLGLNSSALAVAINMVCSDDWRPGVPPYLLVRHLLGLHSVEQCLQAIARIRRSSSRSLTICDLKRSVTVEMTATSFDVLEGEELFHTNHFLSSVLIPSDTINFLAKSSSVHRLRKLRKLAADLSNEPAVTQLFDLFADHENHPVGLCSHSDGDPRRTETVATVVMYPSAGVMYVRKGSPCRASSIERYVLDDRNITCRVSGSIAAAAPLPAVSKPSLCRETETGVVRK